MVRPFAIKGRKRKKRCALYDKEELHQKENEQIIDDEENVKKKVKAKRDEDDAKAEHVANQLSGIPIGPFDQDNKKRGVIFVLEKASLEVAKVGKAMLMILDSTLNKAGKLRALYVRTEKGVLFEVKPHVRIPRTYKWFSGIILQLLQEA